MARALAPPALHAASVLLLSSALLLLPPHPAQAVTFLQQIERLRLIYALLLDYRPAQAPLGSGLGGVELALELIPNPDVDHRVGAKDEPIAPPATIPRLRARLRSDGGWLLGATASAPVDVGGYTATWLGMEAGLGGGLGRMLSELRLFAITGEVTGPLTATDAEDTFTFSNAGADLRVGVPLGPLQPYLGAGLGRTSTTLEIGADGARDEGRAGYTYLLGGVTFAARSLLLTFEQHATSDALRHYLLAATWRW